MNHLNEILGPAIGFLTTTLTLLFVALNAHRTAKPIAPAPAPDPAPEAESGAAT